MFFFESAHPQTYKFDGLDSNHPEMVVVYGSQGFPDWLSLLANIINTYH